jgi:hypothetical protein
VGHCGATGRYSSGSGTISRNRDRD